MKRALDIIVAGLALIGLSPVLLAIAIAVKLTSRGPVLYRWKIVAQGGLPIVSYKFRSMYVDADQRKAELMAQNEMYGPVFKMKNDPRITAVGRLIRKYSLDELPQLWSVLKGDLTLVGPRPPLQSEYASFTDFQKQKLQVKPGLTCLWQIKGRNAIKDLDDWVKLDVEYIKTRSFGTDLKILIKTIPVVVFGRGH